MIFFLYGADTYRSIEKLNFLKKRYSAVRKNGSFNITEIETTNLSVNEFKQRVYSSGLFDQRRMLIIKSVFQCQKDDLLKVILEYLQKECSEKDNNIIFYDSDFNFKKNKNILLKQIFLFLTKKSADKIHYCQKFFLLKDSELRQWIEQEVDKQKGKINPLAVNCLAQLVGNDLWQMNNEINKLIAFCFPKEITIQDVNFVVNKNLDKDIFNLTNALGRKDKARALSLLEEQLTEGTKADYLLKMLVYQFRILLLLKDTNLDIYTLAKRFIINPYAIRKSEPLVNNFSLEELKKIYQGLLQIDLQSKIGSISTEGLVGLAINKLIT